MAAEDDKPKGAPQPPSKPREKKEREPDPEPAGAPEWVVTFTDMISLLVTFFVLLMTFSSMREYDLIRVRGILQLDKGIFPQDGGERLLDPPPNDLQEHTDPLNGASEAHTRPSDFDVDPEDDQFRKKGDHESARDLNDIADGLLVQWDARAAFAPGSAEPNAYLRAALLDIAKTFAAYPHVLVVEGHAAPDHVATRLAPDPVSMSYARARACARILVDEGGLEAERVSIAAYGASRPKALNDTADGRNSNRRVEIRVLALPQDRAAYVGGGPGGGFR
ncbi:MAG: flagellar motor protein MotB [Planctomycetota bacterium]